MFNMPNIGRDLIRIHSVINRSLKVATENSLTFQHGGFSNDLIKEGFISYVISLASVLDAHFRLEDELVFPYLRYRLPDMPYDILKAQHREMLPVLNQIKDIIEELDADNQTADSLNRLNQALRILSELWQAHIRLEEDHITGDRVELLISLEDQIKMSKIFAEHNQQHTGPDYLIAPFLLYNLPPEERMIIALTMPPQVTQELVPVVWKEKWEPMKPFLLS